MWVEERTTSASATHYAYRALAMAGGKGHYKSNYGNFLSFWDVLFGTALMTRRFSAKVGLRDDIAYGEESWIAELLYPIFKSNRSHSALGKHRVIVE